MQTFSRSNIPAFKSGTHVLSCPSLDKDQKFFTALRIAAHNEGLQFQSDGIGAISDPSEAVKNVRIAFLDASKNPASAESIDRIFTAARDSLGMTDEAIRSGAELESWMQELHKASE